MNVPSPYVAREVERAASDLRRGEPILLLGVESEPLLVRSYEHSPDEDAISDASHPAVRLMKIAGLLPRAILSKPASHEEGLLTVSAEAIKAYPAALAATVMKVSEARVPLAGAGDARILAFRPRFGHEEHLAVIIGNPEAQTAPYVRIHSSCVTGDVFASLRCDCGSQLHKALAIIREAGAGAIVYLSQEGRGIGIANKLRAYHLQDTGLDTVEANLALGFKADERDFEIAANILKELNLNRITLLTNNPGKVEALEAHGIKVENRVPLKGDTNPQNAGYLDTKAIKLGHQF